MNDVLPEEPEAAKGARGGIKGKPVKPGDTTTTPPTEPPPVKDTVGKAVAMIDFDGHNNTYYRFTQGYREGILDVTTPEQRQTIVDSIAFDYKQWPIVFTTDEAVYQSAPTQKRMRVVYTTDFEWYPNLAGGVADPYSFEKVDAVCFVFVGQTRIVPTETKFLYEAGGHELGHTFGWFHIANWVDGILTGNHCTQLDAGDGQAHNMGIPYYYTTRVAAGRMANGLWDDPYTKINAMLD